MTVNEDAERMKQLLTEAITVLCKSGFNFTSHFCVEGLLGITFDSKDIVLLNIKETVKVETGNIWFSSKFNAYFAKRTVL